MAFLAAALPFIAAAATVATTAYMAANQPDFSNSVAPQIPLDQPQKDEAQKPAPVDSEAIKNARIADLANARRTGRDSLRVDLATPPQGGAGVFIPK